MNTVREQIQQDCDDVAAHVKDFKLAVHNMTEAQRSLAMLDGQMMSALRVFRSKSFINGNNKVMDQLDLLEKSIEQIREYRNRMDFGTFVVRADRAMEATWEAVP